MNDPLADLLADEMDDLEGWRWPRVASALAQRLRADRDRVTLLLYADDRDAALRNSGRNIDHAYKVRAWWDGTIGVDGNLTGVTEGSEGDPELWEPWARERYAIPLYVREPLGEDQ